MDTLNDNEIKSRLKNAVKRELSERTRNHYRIKIYILLSGFSLAVIFTCLGMGWVNHCVPQREINELINVADTLIEIEDYAEAKELLERKEPNQKIELKLAELDVLVYNNFLTELKQVINNRIDITEESKEAYEICVDNDKELKKYRDFEFKDSKVNTLLTNYLNGVDIQEDAIGYYETEYEKFKSLWKKGYSLRAETIIKLYDANKLEISKKLYEDYTLDLLEYDIADALSSTSIIADNENRNYILTFSVKNSYEADLYDLQIGGKANDYELEGISIEEWLSGEIKEITLTVPATVISDNELNLFIDLIKSR